MKNHEVRIGMSVYWVRTEPYEGQIKWTSGTGLMGLAPNEGAAVYAARQALRAREASWA